MSNEVVKWTFLKHNINNNQMINLTFAHGRYRFSKSVDFPQACHRMTLASGLQTRSRSVRKRASPPRHPAAGSAAGQQQRCHTLPFMRGLEHKEEEGYERGKAITAWLYRRRNREKAKPR